MLTNTRTFESQTLDNIVPSWLFPCSCYLPWHLTSPKQMCLWNQPLHSNSPFTQNLHHKVQFIQFPFCNDRYFTDARDRKETRYNSILHNNKLQRGETKLLMVLTSGARDTTHVHTKEALHKPFDISYNCYLRYLKQNQYYSHKILHSYSPN